MADSRVVITLKPGQEPTGDDLADAVIIPSWMSQKLQNAKGSAYRAGLTGGGKLGRGIRAAGLNQLAFVELSTRRQMELLLRQDQVRMDDNLRVFTTGNRRYSRLYSSRIHSGIRGFELAVAESIHEETVTQAELVPKALVLFTLGQVLMIMSDNLARCEKLRTVLYAARAKLAQTSPTRSGRYRRSFAYTRAGRGIGSTPPARSQLGCSRRVTYGIFNFADYALRLERPGYPSRHPFTTTYDYLQSTFGNEFDIRYRMISRADAGVSGEGSTSFYPLIEIGDQGSMEKTGKLLTIRRFRHALREYGRRKTLYKAGNPSWLSPD